MGSEEFKINRKLFDKWGSQTGVVGGNSPVKCYVADVSKVCSACIFRVRQSVALSTITKRVFLDGRTGLRVPRKCEFLDCLTVDPLSS
jgi:hypothetical protein